MLRIPRSFFTHFSRELTRYIPGKEYDKMKYDFTSILDRKGKDALAVDGIGVLQGAPEAPADGFDVIPMWVADMNFPTAPCVQEAIINRVKHPAFGYYQPSDGFYRSIIRWQERRNRVSGLSPKHIGYENGVLGGAASALRTLCSRGDSILVHSPTYIGFTSLLKNNGYNIVSSPLYLDEQNIWRMDYEDMESKIKEFKIHAAVFCSPHNPCGRVWEKDELEAAFENFRRNDVIVISDEIWSDLTLKGYTHIPSQSISEDARNRTIALYSTSKTFSLAGIVGSYHIIYNNYLRDRILKESSLCHYNDMNVLTMHALIGAYSNEGEEWVEELRSVLTDNVRYAVQYIREHFPGVNAAVPQGTYMLFADCREWCLKRGLTLKELEKQMWRVGVACQDGAAFGGEYSIRINLALPKSRVEEAMKRLQKYVFTEG